MISVCIATYNGEKYIKDQISSILSQLGEEDEVLISDDLSTDQTISVIKSFKDSRLNILPSGDCRLGVVKNFEKVILQAKGSYIFLSDQDDVWISGKVERCMKELKKNILVVTDCKIVDKALVVVQPSFFEIRGSNQGIIRNIVKNSYLGCCMAFRKELLPYILPIPKIVPMHDMWIGLVAEMTDSVIFIEEPLTLYRRHEKNASPTAEKSCFTLYQQIKFRLILSSLLAVRYARNIMQ